MKNTKGITLVALGDNDSAFINISGDKHTNINSNRIA